MDDLDKKVFELFSGRVVPKGAQRKSRIAQCADLFTGISAGHILYLPMMRRKSQPV
jgi:hypothetical protein